jgi:hypothetical protein
MPDDNSQVVIEMEPRAVLTLTVVVYLDGAGRLQASLVVPPSSAETGVPLKDSLALALEVIGKAKAQTGEAGNVVGT